MALSAENFSSAYWVGKNVHTRSEKCAYWVGKMCILNRNKPYIKGILVISVVYYFFFCHCVDQPH